MNLRTTLSVAALTAAAALTVTTAATAAGTHPTARAAAASAVRPAAKPAGKPTGKPAGRPAVRPAAAHAPRVTVVRPGQIVHTGHGVDLKLTATRRCVGAPGDWTCKSVVDGNQAPGSVSLQTQGDASGTLYTPLYIGGGKVARITVATGGVTYALRVVTLAGHPGYATGYVWGAPRTGFPEPGDTVVTVYNAAGKVLAQF